MDEMSTPNVRGLTKQCKSKSEKRRYECRRRIEIIEELRSAGLGLDEYFTVTGAQDAGR